MNFEEWVRHYFTKSQLENDIGCETKEFLSDCFKYQQERIDQLKKENAELRDTIKELELATEGYRYRGVEERLRKENSDLRGMIHRMKLNSKGLCHLVDNLKDSCVINMNDAKEFCDKMCGDIEVKEKEND